MSIRVVNPANGASVLTVASPDAYGTPMVLQAGAVLDVVPGSAWEAAIGLSNLTPLAGTALADDQQGEGGNPGGTGNS